MSDHVLASANIEVGVHRSVTVFGLALNIDTIWTTAIASLIVIGLGLALRRSVTKAVPTKVQAFWETIVETTEAQVKENIGKPSPFVVPLAVTIFTFVLVANWLELLPSDGYLRSPSAQVVAPEQPPACYRTFVPIAHYRAIARLKSRPYRRDRVP